MGVDASMTTVSVLYRHAARSSEARVRVELRDDRLVSRDKPSSSGQTLGPSPGLRGSWARG